jgi:hypothetical protein
VTQLHLLLAYASAALVALTLLSALIGIALGGRMSLLVDRLILLSALALLIAALVGLPLPILGAPLRDVLHLLYAVVAPVVLLGARYLGRGPSPRRFTIVAVGAIALLGVIYRLFTTA